MFFQTQVELTRLVEDINNIRVQKILWNNFWTRDVSCHGVAKLILPRSFIAASWLGMACTFGEDKTTHFLFVIHVTTGINDNTIVCCLEDKMCTWWQVTETRCPWLVISTNQCSFMYFERSTFVAERHTSGDGRKSSVKWLSPCWVLSVYVRKGKQDQG